MLEIDSNLLTKQSQKTQGPHSNPIGLMIMMTASEVYGNIRSFASFSTGDKHFK
jgi:hypothetical protein